MQKPLNGLILESFWSILIHAFILDRLLCYTDDSVGCKFDKEESFFL